MKKTTKKVITVSTQAADTFILKKIFGSGMGTLIQSKMEINNIKIVWEKSIYWWKIFGNTKNKAK